MSLQLHSNTQVIATLSFAEFELEFILDVESSVSATLQQYGKNAELGRQAYLEGLIAFRSHAQRGTSYTLIPGQDMGVFHVLIPRFIRMIETANDLSGIIPRGKISANLATLARLANAEGMTDHIQQAMHRLRQASVVESYLGRIAIYRHQNELLLEIDKMSQPQETVTTPIEAEKLMSCLQEIHSNFNHNVLAQLSHPR